MDARSGAPLALRVTPSPNPALYGRGSLLARLRRSDSWKLFGGDVHGENEMAADEIAI
jgi:hypothetical protein